MHTIKRSTKQIKNLTQSWFFSHIRTFICIAALQFISHKSVQKIFYNLHIIISNSLMGFKVISQLEKEPLKGLANVKVVSSETISLVMDQ